MNKVLNGKSNLMTKIITVFAAIVLVLSALPATAFAGSVAGGGGGNAGSVHERLRWHVYDYSASGESHNITLSPCRHGSGSSYNFDCVEYGWVEHTISGCGGWTSEYNSACIPTSPGNWGNGGDPLTTELKDQAYNNFGSSISGSHPIYYTGGGTCLVAVWVPTSKWWLPQEEVNTTTKLVKVSNPGNPDDTEENFNDTGKDPEWIYKHGKTSSEYSGKTKPNEFYHENPINAEIWEVQEIHTWEENQSTHEIRNEEYKYVVVGSYNLQRIITYRADSPDNNQTNFRPFNLNKNSDINKGADTYANTGDNGLSAEYGNSSYLLNGSVDNLQGIVDGSALNALDINNDTPFSVRFGNNTFGMDRYNFFEVPETLANGSWEDASGDYANGRVGDMTDVSAGLAGIYRFNLNMNASIGNGDLASLCYKNDEKNGTESYTYKTNNDPSYTYNGGDYDVRFVKSQSSVTTDNEYTASDPSSSSKKMYWCAEYTQQRFFEYGVEYHGTISLTEISPAALVAHLSGNQATVSHTASTSDFRSDGLTQRGLYVGVSSNDYYQPILTATWDVKTLAGDTRK